MALSRTGFLLAAFLGAALLTPGAAWADSAPRTLTMTGQGEAAGIPDTVRISAGATAQAATAAAALTQSNARMTRILAALEKMGVAARQVQTSQFSVAPHYDNDAKGVERLSGYDVTNQVTVTLHAVDKLGTVLDALVAAGANRMEGIQFSIRDSAALLTKARQAAVADATAKAKIYAKAAGVTLGPILSLSENGNENPRPVMMMARMSKAVPIAAGEESLHASVTIVWEIR
jgi:uncharacterized protein YggE